MGKARPRRVHLDSVMLACFGGEPGHAHLAAAASVITASLLTPAKPLEGGFVATGSAGVAATLALALALLADELFFALGVA